MKIIAKNKRATQNGAKKESAQQANDAAERTKPYDG